MVVVGEERGAPILSFVLERIWQRSARAPLQDGLVMS